MTWSDVWHSLGLMQELSQRNTSEQKRQRPSLTWSVLKTLRQAPGQATKVSDHASPLAAPIRLHAACKDMLDYLNAQL